MAGADGRAWATCPGNGGLGDGGQGDGGLGDRGLIVV